ncbi:MAG: hypothetical protein KME54_21685 [Tolypothrix brevis GSE-NOS-MK-07-07A]|nr:hypothetical protein [Tolypothrix brevis GSE-NOS-MK-07-07A]
MTHHQLNQTVDNSTLRERLTSRKLRTSNLTLTVKRSHFSTKPYYTSERLPSRKLRISQPSLTIKRSHFRRVS